MDVRKLNPLWLKLTAWLQRQNKLSATRLNPELHRFPFPQFSLLGLCKGASPNFVSHAALLAIPSELPGNVAVFHMGPPLVTQDNDIRFEPWERELEPDLVVDLGLNEEQMTLLARWTAQISREDGPMKDRRYVIRPHVKPKLNERGIVQYHCFSCAGYAIEAYRAANIDLCDTNNLPSISLEILRTSYVRLDDLMKKPKLRELHGISEDPPWDVLMPAYLFHGADHLIARRRPTYRVPSQPHEAYVSYPANK